jgi:transcriptional regulator with XRE-family HTH domain
MPRHMRRLDPSKAGEGFALELRRLRDSAVKGKNFINLEQQLLAQPLSIDDAANKFGVSRSSIYAALSGKRLPSRPTLLAMVRAWDPRGEAAIDEWMDKRRLVDEAQVTDVANVTNVVNPITSVHSESARSDVSDGSVRSHNPRFARYHLGRFLTDLRIERKWTVKSLAAGSNMAYSSISAILRGASTPSLSTLERLLHLLGASDTERRQARDLLDETRRVQQIPYSVAKYGPEGSGRG